MAVVAVIGAGPAGLMAAEVLAAGGCRVVVFDRMPSAGRKLLIAGRGGLNLTHSEDLDAFLDRYGPARPMLEPAIRAFPPAALVDWAQGLGEATFVGSSGRVFPKKLKASPLLRAWLTRLAGLGVELRLRHTWRGWAPDGALLFDADGSPTTFHAAACVLALGGASWPRLGADGGWRPILEREGVQITPFAPANCGLTVDWSPYLISKFAGTPLKRIAISHDGRRSRGEAVVTRPGLEGGVVYALTPGVREALQHAPATTIEIDLRPDMTLEALAARLNRPRGKQSTSNHLRKLGVSPIEQALLRETTPGLVPVDPGSLATRLKALPLTVTGTAGLERAISTAGGIARSEVDGHFMLLKRRGVFAAGEMLDWEAPTGGYLLQACFSTGRAAGQGALAWLDHAKPHPAQ